MVVKDYNEQALLTKHNLVPDEVPRKRTVVRVATLHSVSSPQGIREYHESQACTWIGG